MSEQFHFYDDPDYLFRTASDDEVFIGEYTFRKQLGQSNVSIPGITRVWRFLEDNTGVILDTHGKVDEVIDDGLHCVRKIEPDDQYSVDGLVTGLATFELLDRGGLGFKSLSAIVKLAEHFTDDRIDEIAPFRPLVE